MYAKIHEPNIEIGLAWFDLNRKLIDSLSIFGVLSII